MAETLGSLCDKLTIIKLKQLHSVDQKKQHSLLQQETQLKSEIDEFLGAAISGNLPYDRLKFSANKVYKKLGNEIDKINGSTGYLIASLAEINYQLWKEQEKVYDFENVPIGEKNMVIKKLALLNLKRNQCIDAIDEQMQLIVKKIFANNV